MGGDNSQTTTSGLNNSALNTAVTTIGNQLNTALGQGSAVFGQSMYPGISTQTWKAADGMVANSQNPDYAAGVSGAIKNQSDIAAGNFGNDPVRARLMDDVAQNVNSSFLTDGRFGSMGSGAHSDTLASETAAALAPYDYGRQQQAIQNLPGLFQASQMPYQAQAQAGSIFDADMLARRQGEADLFDRTNNQIWNTLGRAGSVLAGTSGAAGTTTTQTQNTPWWQSVGSFGLGALGLLG